MNNAANRLTVITMTSNDCNYRAALLPEQRVFADFVRRA